MKCVVLVLRVLKNYRCISLFPLLPVLLRVLCFTPHTCLGVSSIDLTIIGNYFTYHTEYDNIEYLGYIDPGFRGVK